MTRAYQESIQTYYTFVLYVCMIRGMENQNILISGASVAGPALAYWLRRRGFNPTVVERAPSLRGGGYAVDFRGAAHLSVLAKMGLLDQVRDQQTHLDTTTYVDAGGRAVASMPVEIFAGDVEILRGDLGRILYQATRDGTEYLFGDTITSLDEHADGVHVTFSRAAPRVFDLVIGADGLHSAVRRLAFPDAAGARQDLGLYVSIFSVADSFGLDHSGLLHSVPGRTAAVFSARPTGRAVAQFFFAVTPPSSRRSWPTPSPGWAGTYPNCWPRCPGPRTSTSTRSARYGWTGGRPGGWRSSATPGTRPARAGTAPARRSSRRTCWPASWPRRAATTGRRSAGTSGCCAPTWPGDRSRPSAGGITWPRPPRRRSASATGSSACYPTCRPSG